MAATESDLHNEMLSLYDRTVQATGGAYKPNRFKPLVKKNGGLVAAKKLLAPGQDLTGVRRLADARRMDLSVEFIALSDHYSHLFTREELTEARNRLAQLPSSAFPSPVDLATIGEIDGSEANYHEGAVQSITVNRYERDPRARAACIRHHGTKCKVCEFDFEARYGELGRGFIHVHHRRPLNRPRALNSVDPKRDLVPVCPNCHAMLHRRDPPYDIEQLVSKLRPDIA